MIVSRRREELMLLGGFRLSDREQISEFLQSSPLFRFDDVFVDESRDGSEPSPWAVLRIFLWREKADSFLESLTEGDVACAEAFVGQMRVEHCPDLLRCFAYGVQFGYEVRGVSGEALGEVLEQVCDLVAVPPEAGVLYDALDIEEPVLPDRIPGYCRRVVPGVQGSHGRVLADAPQDSPIDDPPGHGSIFPLVVTDSDRLFQKEDEVGSGPPVAGGLFANKLAQRAEYAAHVGLEVIDHASDGIATLNLCGPQRRPGAFPSNSIRIEGQRDEQQPRHVVVPGSGDRPVENLRFDRIRQGLSLGALPGAVDDVAAFGAQGVDRLPGLPVEEDVVVL